MKKIFNIISIIFILGAIVASCDDKPNVYEFPVGEYFYEIPDVPVTEDYVIGVRYDTKGRDSLRNIWWDGGATPQRRTLYTGTPVLGEYDTREDSATVIRQHMDWGKKAGIDFFVISWGGHGYNDTILMQWERLWREGDPRVVIRFDPNYLHNRTGQGTDTLQLNKLRMDTLRADFDSLYVHVMSKDYVYKNKNTGYPTMILCEFTGKQGDITDLNAFVNFFRAENKFTQKKNDLFIIGELGGSVWTSPENWGWRAEGDKYGIFKADTISTLEAMYTNDLQHTNYDRYLGQYSFLDYNYRYWQNTLAPLGKEYIPTIYPAFDNRIREPNSTQFFIPRWREGVDTAYIVSPIQEGIIPGEGFVEELKGLGEQYNFSDIKKNPYQEWANVAKRNVGPSRIIMVRSWNDFGTGNTLEPTKEYGETYLDYTRRFFKK